MKVYIIMARVTVEDCLEHVDSNFELILKASKRARAIAQNNVTPLVPEEGDKATVIALREIAENVTEKAAAAQFTYQSENGQEGFKFNTL